MNSAYEKCEVCQEFTLYLQFLYHTTGNEITWQNFRSKITIVIKLTVNKDKETNTGKGTILSELLFGKELPFLS